MKIYFTRSKKLPGTDFREVHKKARVLYEQLRKRTKRRTYVRSHYFNKQKIFVDLFWSHLFQKHNMRDRFRRLRFFGCALELLGNSNISPSTIVNPHKSSELLHRFAGITPDREIFYVQVKEDKASGQKYLLSVFPEK